MFSGIVEEVGRVESYDGRRLTISGNKALIGLNVSDSILVSGACLTVVEKNDASFTVETVPETVSRTCLDAINAGDGVNLERSLSYGDRVGGHLVQGHVDCAGRITAMTPDGNSTRVSVEAPANIMRYVVEKGFIALDGISLTIVDRSRYRLFGGHHPVHEGQHHIEIAPGRRQGEPRSRHHGQVPGTTGRGIPGSQHAEGHLNQ